MPCPLATGNCKGNRRAPACQPCASGFDNRSVQSRVDRLYTRDERLHFANKEILFLPGVVLVYSKACRQPLLFSEFLMDLNSRAQLLADRRVSAHRKYLSSRVSRRSAAVNSPSRIDVDRGIARQKLKQLVAFLTPGRSMEQLAAFNENN